MDKAPAGDFRGVDHAPALFRVRPPGQLQCFPRRHCLTIVAGQVRIAIRAKSVRSSHGAPTVRSTEGSEVLALLLGHRATGIRTPAAVCGNLPPCLVAPPRLAHPGEPCRDLPRRSTTRTWVGIVVEHRHTPRMHARRTTRTERRRIALTSSRQISANRGGMHETGVVRLARFCQVAAIECKESVWTLRIAPWRRATAVDACGRRLVIARWILPLAALPPPSRRRRHRGRHVPSGVGMETAKSAEDVTARRYYAGEPHLSRSESTISGARGTRTQR